MPGLQQRRTFERPETFLTRLVAKGDRPPKLLSHNQLRAIFLDVLSAESAAHPLPAAVQSYLSSSSADAGTRDVRRFQLASRLAGLARQYGDTRPELLRAWAKGQATLSGDPLQTIEEWQRDLWARVIEVVGQASRIDVNGETRWILPQELFGFLESEGAEAPGEIHLFGFSYMWHGLRDMIVKLVEASTVHIYTLAPFIEFREDLRSLGPVMEAGSGNSPRAKAQSTRADHNDAMMVDNLPLVAHWGRPSHEFFSMLAEFSGARFHPDFVKARSETVLGRLQNEILERAVVNEALLQPDSSLVFLGCAGIRREAEAVANEIWKLISEGDEPQRIAPDRLRFCDVAVLLADRTNQAAYQAHFRAVFEDLHGIPFNMVDVPLAGECQVIAAMLLLLDLPLGEFTRPEVLRVLGHPAVRARFPETDHGRWRDWCLQLEIIHGADQSDHDGTYIDRDLFHWEQGLRRLVLGVFMTGPQSGDERVFHIGTQDYAPHDQPPDTLASIARLLVLVRSLIADARFASTARLTMTQWSDFFWRMMNAYLAADSEAEQRAFAQCLDEVYALRDLDVTGRPVGFRIASLSLRRALESLTVARGHYLADGVVISPVLEMRSLPFRIIFLCGLGEGRFPAADGPDPLDLALVQHRVGDVSSHERDKYLFLETLICRVTGSTFPMSIEIHRQAMRWNHLRLSANSCGIFVMGKAVSRRSSWSKYSRCSDLTSHIFLRKQAISHKSPWRPITQLLRGWNFVRAASERRCALTWERIHRSHGTRYGGSSHLSPTGWACARSRPRQVAAGSHAGGQSQFGACEASWSVRSKAGRGICCSFQRMKRRMKPLGKMSVSRRQGSTKRSCCARSFSTRSTNDRRRIIPCSSRRSTTVMPRCGFSAGWLRSASSVRSSGAGISPALRPGMRRFRSEDYSIDARFMSINLAAPMSLNALTGWKTQLRSMFCSKTVDLQSPLTWSVARSWCRETYQGQ